MILPFLAASLPMSGAMARPVTRVDAMRAAIHPVATNADMQRWLSRVPVTKEFPPDFAATLGGEASLFIIEMTTAPGCLPCADLWAKLAQYSRHYHWAVAPTRLPNRGPRRRLGIRDPSQECRVD